MPEEKNHLVYSLEQVTEIFGPDQERLIGLNRNFVQTMQENLPELERAFEEKDTIAIEGFTHRIKASLHLYGMVHLYHAAHRIERICRNQYPIYRALPDLEILRSEIPKACEVIDAETRRIKLNTRHDIN